MAYAYDNNPIYDNHTLYVRCDCATPDQIRTAFYESLENYQKTTGNSIECRFCVNRVEDRWGKPFGIAFVYVSNSEVYQMLIGNNPDGSDRINYIDDPSWDLPSEGTLANSDGWTVGPSKEKISWADEMEEDDIHIQSVAKSTCPKIPIRLEPLMTLPAFKLTEEQKEKKKELIIELNTDKPEFDQKLIQIPDFAHFSVDRAKVYPVESAFMPNILKTSRIPEWITEKDLKIKFLPYASDNVTIHKRNIGGRRVDESYPWVNINNERTGFITFDPQTHDAQFALHMMKKVSISKHTPGGVTLSATLIFHHSLRTDRDRMTAINQQPHLLQDKHKFLSKSDASSKNNRHKNKNKQSTSSK